MWKHLTFKIYRTFISFKRYVKSYRALAYNTYAAMEHGYYHYSKEQYLDVRKFLLADARFFSMLTIRERKAIDSMIDDYDLNKYDNKYLRSAFNKYSRVFFGEQMYKGCIDRIKLGILLETIRKSNRTTIVELARLIKISTRTIQRIEDGETMPSLEYIYLFCKYFDEAIENLLSLVIVE